MPDRTQAEPEFFKSLAILSSLYGISPMDVSGKPYPYNILLAHWDMTKQLNKGLQRMELTIVEDETDEVQLATTQSFNTGSSLYYIPLLPLYRLLQKSEQRKTGELLLSVCAYLFQVADIPCYREGHSALAYYYEMIEEGIAQDLDGYDEGELNGFFSEINAAKYFGDKMLGRITSSYHLQQLTRRTKAFKAGNEFELDCLKVATEALSVWNAYPDYRIFRNIVPQEDEFEQAIIRAEQYISFVAENNGWLADNIFQTVNNEFNECTAMEEPIVIQIFNRQDALIKEGLDFEHRLFSLTGDLCSLLNDLP